MNIQHPVERRGRALIEDRGELVARDHASGGSHQNVKDVKFGRGRLHALVIGEHFASAGDQPLPR